MRTRTIVALVVAGMALLFGPGLLRGDGGSTSVAQLPSQAPRETTPAAAPPTSRGSSAASMPTSAAPSATTSTSTSTPTTTTISPAEIKRQLANVDRLERDQPLTQHLPHDSAHFNIDYRVGADGKLTLQMTLRAVLNRADQIGQYRDQLRAYKAEALDWLRSVGADPAAYATDYLPPEAAAL